jgi:RHS repeat-associated protein
MGETTTTNYALDWVHPLAHTTNNPHYVLSPGGKNTFFDYDPNLRKKDQVVAFSFLGDESWTLFEYDDVGNLTKITDPRLKETKFGYDGRNRKSWMDDPIASDRNSSGHTMNWEYDLVGNKTKETRADNAFRSWDYDSMNRLYHAIDWRMNASETAVTTTYTYELHNAQNVTIEHVIDAKLADYKFEFDALHRKMSETYPPAAGNSNPSEHFWYDPAGSLTQYRNPAGQIKHISHDNRNRVFDAWWDGNVAPLIATRFDDASRVISVETPETFVHFGYNNANRVIWEEQGLLGYPARLIEKAPDPDGNATQLRVSTSGTADFFVHYDYTQRSQLAHITADDYSPLYTYTYDAAGNMIRRHGEILGDSTNAPSAYYDELNRPTYWEQTRGGDVAFSGTHYQYDNVGHEVAVWRDEDGSKGERYWFNVADHITRAVYKADNVWTANPSNWDHFRDYNYTPDLLNWTSVNDNGYLAPLEHNGLNQYTSINGFGRSYDGNFNQTTNSNGASFIYNAQNQAVGGGIQATYDGLGRCLKRTIGNNTILFAYDGWKPVTEYDSGGNLHARNIYGPGADEILMRGDWTYGWSFYHADKQGSVTAVVDINGNVVEKYKYDAFGRPTILSANNTQLSTSAVGNRFMFTGREWLSDLNLYDYRHRLYNPDSGRFLQADPMGLQTEGAKLSAEQKALYSSGGVAPDAFTSSEMNLYRYCGDDPVDKSDPTGLLTVIVPGYGPGQSEDANTKWSNQQFIQYAKATDPHNYAVFKRSDKAGMLKAIMNARAHGDKTVKIFGYSRGAVAAVELAQRLQTLNISVDRLLSVDPIRLPTDTSRNFSVPNNVTKAENYYQGLAHSGFLVFPSMRLNGAVENHPLSGTLPDGTEIIHQNMPSVVSKVGGY